jgi:hypothetical protein
MIIALLLGTGIFWTAASLVMANKGAVHAPRAGPLNTAKRNRY